jgi:DUF1680 family protein
VNTTPIELPKDYPIQPAPFSDVRLDDAFWSPRLETNRRVTIPFAFHKCEETGRIDNFAVAGGLVKGVFRGEYPFDDSDLYKIIEGAAYTLSLERDGALEEYLDDLIVKIAAAQEDDGYLYTVRTIDPTGLPHWIGEERWSNLVLSHELYNAGHLYEAAVAHYQATGKRALLDVAIRNADLIARVFGPDGKRDAPGHQEIEIGLVKLYRATGDERYLRLAQFFLDERGHAVGRMLYGEYAQDHKPVIEQREAVGHAVRATYMYSAMADVAALTGDAGYGEAIGRIWENVVSKKLSLTGGIGARHQGEAFGDDYELPNRTAYNETCAAIGNAMWNHRMFLLHGDARYLDVLERVLYNGFLAGVSMGGDEFFYPNPLESDGEYTFNQGAATRSPWFNCSCCPSNIARFTPSLAGYVYAHRDDVLYVNLFVGGSGVVEMDNNVVRIAQQTRYPWDGDIQITVEPERAGELEVRVRIPGWARNRPAPGDLYRYMSGSEAPATPKINAKPFAFDLERGFASIRRVWEKGDVIELSLPMPVRRVLCHDQVEENVGKVALERGPIVYCAEWPDNGGQVFNLVVPDDAALEAEYREDLLNGVVVISGKRDQSLVAIPYYAWSHRGAGEMAVWLPRDASASCGV